jgi:hypothetical protein
MKGYAALLNERLGQQLMTIFLQVLKSLVLLYLSPATAENQELRQCLSYFLPVYCYSSPANQRKMQSVGALHLSFFFAELMPLADLPRRA